ncbi:MAG TPA: tRNA 2-selenouridine(34) synthase MnmH, partial [Chitinophagaceae bacterium]|nr:tRNA 2-selenouridine(34) synthase MnmH [Chitinophagaceae bacterium]
MAITRLNTNEFLAMAAQHPLLDVRSPGEYTHAHIPGAYSFPLFNDEERKEIGTAYKQQSQQIAIKIGLGYFGGRMVEMVETGEKILAAHPNADSKSKTVLVHCWRGGMRSAGVAWLLDLYGLKVYTLVGGYKAYRNHVLQVLSQDYPIHIIGGYTGSAKTELLYTLQQKGEQIIDLEALAAHKGSAFGNLGMPAQPTQEMFDNLLAEAVRKLDSNKTIWLEDESQRIGHVNIDFRFFRMMRTKPVLFLDIPFEARLQHIIKGYGQFEKEKLLTTIVRIKKRLGGLETKNAVNFLLEDDIANCFRILLKYY